jgi:hypothetical protein
VLLTGDREAAGQQHPLGVDEVQGGQPVVSLYEGVNRSSSGISSSVMYCTHCL